MKKLLLITIFAAITSLVLAQYDSDKLPSGLQTAASLDSADYVILQKAGETYVKAIPAYYFISLVTDVLGDLNPLTVESLIVNSVSYLDSIVLNSVPISTISGESGRMLSADGSGWIDTVPAKYEGDSSFTFGIRSGTVGNFSFVFGNTNTATAPGAVSMGSSNANSGHYALVHGTDNSNTAANSFVQGRENTNTGASSLVRGNNNNNSGSYSILNAINNENTGKYSLILAGNNSKIVDDYNGVLLCDTVEVLSGTNNFIVNSNNLDIDGNNNTIFNSFNSDISGSRMFLVNSALSQYKGADSVSFVFTSFYDTVDISNSVMQFTAANKGTVYASNISGMGRQTWSDTIYESFLFNSNFYNDTATRIEQVIAFKANNLVQKAGLKANFTAVSDGAYFSNNQQWVGGNWNDSTDASCDRLLSIGNGTAAGFRSDAFNVFKSGVGIFGGAIGLGDTATVCGLTSEAQEGMIANDENGDLMQFDGVEWQKFNKESTDYKFGAYVPSDSTQTTTTTASGTYYFVGEGDNNKFINYVNLGFGFDGDTLTYTGTDTLWFELHGSITAQSDVDSTTARFSVMVNDSVMPQTCSCNFMKTLGESYVFSQSGLIRLATNDKIKLMVQSDKDGAVITTINYSVTLTKQ